MLARIHPLDDGTIAQIAAGEVIERPVSVVKELVENSLDAGATHVRVDLEAGGAALIAVADNGAGIHRDDLRTALGRHTTSKLSSAGDLFGVRTLGFRGEGLASIAAAASVELISRPALEDVGARIEARGTTIGEPVATPASPGTRVVARDLFRDLPARREFLKSARAEFARVSAFLSHLALGWPHVHFTLRHDDREVWTLPAVADLAERLEMVFGRGARAALIPLRGDDERGPERVRGYVSGPGHDRPSRDQQVFFVNGRLVRSASIGAAWLAGYGSFGMTGRYPFGVIVLEVPPESVDVNVHPTKAEVRFARAPIVFEAVKRAVQRSLRSVAPVRELEAAAGARLTAVGDRAAHRLSATTTAGAELSLLSSTVDDAPSVTDDWRIYGQIDHTYIVAADDQGLLILDQHAAHERIAYEALQERSARIDTASLLFPTIVELTPALASALHEFERELESVGVIVEPFGDRTYRITALPAGYEKRRFDLAGVLDDLLAQDAPREGPAHVNRLLATIACHSVVRAHEALSLQEQAALFQRLGRCREPHTCPHGRPTMLRLNPTALARAFHRT